ncbi:uncharacterized protein PAC_02273 [Phialocephala subalpina]|uniref:SMP-30/Gluconolactonase/LRE-like region domain-containing protein n=1 Tax=Phialocephala subalpina TaxID=576137 RepID=A0A1L7WHZ8_9HELO|nr:uncharacterized protein PAC_02273 [Phialocephala subalpina]
MRTGSLSALVSLFSLISALTLPQTHSSNHGTNLPNLYTIYEFPNPTWVENIAVRSNGQILVDLITSPDLYIMDPRPNSSATLIHSFPSLAVFGITETTPDNFHLIAGNFSLSPLSIGNGTFSIWTVDLSSYSYETNTGVKIFEVVLIKESGLLNGLSTLSAEKGLIVAADSVNGYLWIINVNTGIYSILLQGPELENPGPGFALGINGVRVLPYEEEDTAWVYFDNQAKSTFHRVLVSLDTLRNTSAIETLATNITADDFTLDPETGYAYLAAGTVNQIFRVPLEGGAPEHVLGGLNSSVVVNPTSLAVAREGGVELGNRLCITTTGGD